jgi:stress-induced morphogen
MSTIKNLMPLDKKEFEAIIKEKFKEVKVILTDLVGDMDHYSIEISSPDFEGLDLLARHRLINQRLAEYIGTKVHALTIKSINLI